MGAMDGMSLQEAEKEVFSGDATSPEWRSAEVLPRTCGCFSLMLTRLRFLKVCLVFRPPHGTDGTPNETANDVLIRVRQVRDGIAVSQLFLCSCKTVTVSCDCCDLLCCSDFLHPAASATLTVLCSLAAALHHRNTVCGE